MWFGHAGSKASLWAVSVPMIETCQKSFGASLHCSIHWCPRTAHPDMHCLVMVQCGQCVLHTPCAMIDGVCVWARTPFGFWVAFGQDSWQYWLDKFVFPPDISLLSAAPFPWAVGKNRLNLILWCQKQFLIVVLFRWVWQGRELECHVF